MLFTFTTRVGGPLKYSHRRARSSLIACDSRYHWQPLATLSCRCSTLILFAVCRTEASLTCACDGGLSKSQSHLSALEHGQKEPGAAVLLAISREFGKSVDWILTGHVPKK